MIQHGDAQTALERRRASSRASQQRRRQSDPGAVRRQGREAYARRLAEDPEGTRTRYRGYAERQLSGLSPAKYLMRQMKSRASTEGYGCSISLVELERLLEPWECALTGLKLRWLPEVDRDSLAPSPDRIDRFRGYVSGNVRIVAWMVNHMRNKYSDEEFLAVARALVARHGR